MNVVSGSGSIGDRLQLNGSNLTCSPTFYLENSTCFPLCEEWMQFSEANTYLVSGTAATVSVLALLGGFAVIAGSIIRYKSM